MKFKFKKDIDTIWVTEGIWYMLTDGGYLSPDMVLENLEEIKAVNEAIDTVCDFINQAYDEDILEDA